MIIIQIIIVVLIIINSIKNFIISELIISISLVLAGICVVYLILVKTLFLKPLTSHSEWVAVNGMFSAKAKSIQKTKSESEVDIIKGEKLKQYSVADELIKWGKLKEDGLISEDEFNEAREKLLKRN